MIKIHFLGTADAIPSAKRNHTAILIVFDGENILIDCGEGTQRQFRKAKLNPCKITKILITHWHADHILGLPGLLKTMALNGYNKTLSLYCPKGTKKVAQTMLKIFKIEEDIKIEIKEAEGKFFETNEVLLEAKKMNHTIPCNGYSFIKKGKRKIDKKKLSKLGLKPSPKLRKLKEGKSITINNKRYSAKDLTFKEEDKKITCILDTAFNTNAITLAKNASVLISESSFDHSLEKNAKKHKHLTATQAATIAKKAKVKQLYLTHISQRYEKNFSTIQKEAKKVFKETNLVKDLDTIVFK